MNAQELIDEEHVKGGKFLVFARSVPEVVARVRSLLVPQGPDHIDRHEPHLLWNHDHHVEPGE
jgi:hypothetical protein